MNGTVALVVAAGRGVRFGGDTPKQYLSLAGRPVLRHCLDAFAAHPAIDQIRVVIGSDDCPLYERACENMWLMEPVIGAGDRQGSVRNGLESLANDPPERVLIHDGARPLIDAPLLDRLVAALDKGTGAIAALPVSDSVKRSEDGLITGEVERSGLWRAQAPQAFHFTGILEAHRAAAEGQHTDDASVARAAGLEVALVTGNAANIKITDQEDLAMAELYLAAREGTLREETRVGTGFDVHRFGPGEQVILGGIAIPHDRGLIGHSDADVALHALTDALLGALAAGDIGEHFPPSDPQWAGADSGQFLAHAVEMVGQAGGRILHLDLTLICERPKIGSHRMAMAARIAELAGLDAGRVSVKATTTERLGFTGRGEGIAAQAAATIALRPS